MRREKSRQVRRDGGKLRFCGQDQSAMCDICRDNLGKIRKGKGVKREELIVIISTGGRRQRDGRPYILAFATFRSARTTPTIMIKR